MLETWVSIQTQVSKRENRSEMLNYILQQCMYYLQRDTHLDSSRLFSHQLLFYSDQIVGNNLFFEKSAVFLQVHMPTIVHASI